MYARAVKAKGQCDRCGFTRPLSALRDEVDNGRRTGLKVCSDCLDPDHPINQRGRTRIVDPQALQDPRPDYTKTTSTSYFGWAPIGNPATMLRIELGDISVEGNI